MTPSSDPLGHPVFDCLDRHFTRPGCFCAYTAKELWTNDHTAKKMLEFHLNPSVDLASRSPGFMDRSVGWMARHFHFTPQTRIADFGCGPGLYTRRMAQKGARVTGIDFSSRAIAYAREKAGELGLEIDYLRANYLELEPDRQFDLVTLIFCDFCALNPDQRQTLLSTIRKCLAPGGFLLLDVLTLDAFEKREQTHVFEPDLMDGFWSAQPYYGFMSTFKYQTEKVVLDKYTIVEKTRIRTVYNWLQYYSRQSLTGELEQAGFEIKAFFANVAGDPVSPACDEIAVIAR